MPSRVSCTPTPSVATASKIGTLKTLRSASSSSTGLTSLRSRLLNCRASGKPSRLIPWSSRFSCRFLKALDVGALHGALRVGDEDHAVGAAQHQLAGGVVVDLAGNGVELESDVHSADRRRFPAGAGRKRWSGRPRWRGRSSCRGRRPRSGRESTPGWWSLPHRPGP